VHAVEAIRVHEAGEAAGAADTGDDAEVVLVDIKRDERLVERGEDAEVAAPGAPDRTQTGTVMATVFGSWVGVAVVTITPLPP